MKNTIAAILLSLFFALAACKKNEKKDSSTEKTEVNQSEKFVVDSVKVSDSTKVNDSLTVKYTSKLLVFPSLKDQKLLDSIYFINKGATDFSKNGIQSYLEREKAEYFNSIRKEAKDLGVSFPQEWYTSNYMNLKSTTNDYMHIEYVYSAYEGGAHDNYGFSERVFDLKNNKKVQLADITTMPKKQIEGILMKNINKMNSGTTDEKGEVKNSDMLLVEVIPASSNFYFDDKNLYFHYSPYEIAAFAAGDITIPVSWEDLKGTLKPEFKERMKIK
ncbi:RsiV family protein [Chryseobacterium proteolyticum]|uniref:RsiV family protein n=1 Tax=Chryseobacterium proteolyticum TaxID=118127 RepID=UPI0039831871